MTSIHENPSKVGVQAGVQLNLKDFILVRQPNPDLGPYLVLRYQVLLLMDSVSLGIADDQTESWNFVSVEQFKI